MPVLSKVLVLTSLAASAVVLAVATWWMYKRRQRQLPLIRQWPYWKFLKKIASLPSLIQNPRFIGIPDVLGENIFNPLHPDTPALFFVNVSLIRNASGTLSNWSRVTLWRHSLLRDKATPSCSFEFRPLGINPFRGLKFVVMGQHLFVGLIRKTSVDVFVFSHQGEFLKRIRLQDTPVITENMGSYLGFEGNHCHLLVQIPAVSRLDSYKFRIDQVTDRGNCIQRKTTPIPQNMVVEKFRMLGDGVELQLNVRGQKRKRSDPVIHYDFQSTSLTVAPRKFFVVNRKHQKRLMRSLWRFQNEMSIFTYRGCQRTSTLSPLDTIRERYLVCRRNIVEDTTGDSPEEEEAVGSNQINVYSIQSEPKSLKSLALSAVLKNLPWVKDLPEGKMRELGIPPNIAHTLEQHKGWENKGGVILGLL